MRLDASDPLAASRYLDELSSTVAERWLSAMLDSSDIRARATGLFLQGRFGGLTPLQPPSEQSREELVRLAEGARDTAVYGIAIAACNTYFGSAKGACEQISLREWSQIDPGNAAPWLMLAGKARSQNDQAAETDAFAHAAAATKADTYNWSLLEFAEPELPKDATPLQRWYLGTAMFGIQGATAVPQYSEAFKYCSEEAVKDASVRSRCSAVAEILVSKGANLLDFSAGARLGSRAGWPKPRVDRLLQERDALMNALMRATPETAGEQYTCKGVELGNAYLRRFVQLGEMGAAREALTNSGDTVEESAQKYNEYLEKLRAP
jgi:hypothetical protein